MVNIWKNKEVINKEVSEQLHLYPKIIRQLLFNRGIYKERDAKLFLETPFIEGLHSPFLFLDMQKAVDRICLAIEHKEKIFVYGDYDADAVTASAVMLQCLFSLGLVAESYIPDRFSEGYGINLEALQKIKDAGAKVIITVDCGTNSIDAAEFCLENNIDLIISDHHEILGDIPKALAVINPKNPAENYPNRDLTGVGVAYKLAQAVLKNCKQSTLVEGWEKWLLDLVAIGTVADCHSLVGENRVLVKYGLKVLAKTKWQGLTALLATAGLELKQKSYDTYTLGFVVAPRLNAAGRLEHASIALNLLMEKDEVMAQERSMVLESINQKRQALTQVVLSEAREQALLLQDRKILVLHGQNWPKGVVGLVAGKIAEEFLKPTIVLEEDEVNATGSARTYGEFDILRAIDSAKEFVIKYGGHKQAAGLTLSVKNIPVFYRKILDFCENDSTLDNPVKSLSIEAELTLEDLTQETMDLMFNFEPHGVGNYKPKFLLKNIKISSFKKVGKTGNHLQFMFDFGGKTFSGIAFNSGYFETFFEIGNTIDMVAEIIKDDWSGGFKFRLIDLKST